MLVVVAAVIQKNGRILICQRNLGGSHPLKWEFPGGKVKAREDTEAALCRELREELGIEAAAGEEITRYPFSYAGRQPILLVFYRVSDYHGEMRNRVFREIRWVTPAELPDYDFLEGDIDFVRRLAASHDGQEDLVP
jgi:8-oxo-dGTP diphosphatase